MKRHIQLLLLLLATIPCLQQAYAQDQTITGTVTSADDGLGMPGVNILLQNTSQGTITDIDGNYSLAAAPTDTLVFSYIGFKQQIIPIEGRSVINIIMENDAQQMREVVVTALNISRDKRSIGYSASEVSVAPLETVRDVNVVNALTGKVAGLQIGKTSGGLASSTKVTIRGNSTFRDNQALFVIDGIPIDNSTFGAPDLWGGIDYGSGASDINPDDIESVTVLKGPNAAALYGSRAANGVILITTKKGKARKGIGLSINSTTSFEMPDIQKDFQNVYGAGENGQFDVNENEHPYFETGITERYGDSYGPKMEGQTYIDWDGVERTYSPQPNNYRDFFELGRTLTNAVSLDGGNETTTFRLSYTNLQNKGTAPNSSLARNTLNFRGTHKITPKILADFKITYTNQHVKNRLSLSNAGAARHIVMMPRNVSNASLQDYKDEQGNEKIWYTSWAWQTNPYWQAFENINQDWRNRYTGHISVNYQITDWLSFMLRTGQDFYNDRRDNIEEATGSFTNPSGAYSQGWINVNERNSDFLLSANRKLGAQIDWSINIGGNQMMQKRELNSTRVDRLSSPNFYHIEFSENAPDVSAFLSEKRINSLYTATQIAFRDYLFLDLTGRQDWSSTLPIKNNNYFYPSASLSWAFTDAFGVKSNVWSFGKLRASWARVATDADPYLLLPSIESTGTFNNSDPSVRISPIIPSPDLRPEFTRSVELGTDLRFFKNKVGIDFTYYDNLTTDLIVQADVANSSGYEKAVLNAGKIANKGYELSLNLSPIKNDKVRWDWQVNFAKNNSEVLQLDENGLLEKLLLEEQFRITVEARPGEAYGVIVAPSIARNEQGEKLVDGDGSYIKGPSKIHGNINPDWRCGVSTNLKIGGFTIGGLVDIKKGGSIYSATNMYGNGYSGIFTSSLEGREEWYASEAARNEAGEALPYYNETSGEWIAEWMPTGGYLAEGIYAEGTIINGEDVSGQPNQSYQNPKAYWSQFTEWTDELHEPHIYDASFVKLREFSIGYQLPKIAVQKIKLRSLSVSLVGRNLWLIHSNVPNIDPEASYNNGNAQGGIEWGTYPVNRSIGVNVKVGL